jgi:hypothetical protein
MKLRTGKECKKFKCAFYVTYVNWSKNLGNSVLENCMNCRNAHVSQYRKGSGIEFIREKQLV